MNMHLMVLCTACRYRAIVQGKWYRHFCALVASTFQMMGTIMYLGSEWHVGFIHLPTFVSYTHLYVFHMCCLGHLAASIQV